MHVQYMSLNVYLKTKKQFISIKSHSKVIKHTETNTTLAFLYIMQKWHIDDIFS